jgi:mono/diheme cytochrome c family protein
MSRRAVALLLAVLLAAAAGCEGTDTGVYWQFERMVRQPRYDPYAHSPLFDDGRTMRPLPAGVVARDADDAGPLVVDGAVGGHYADTIPLPVTPALLALGRRRFETYCAACHGVLGDGDTPVAAQMQLRKPPSLHQARLRDLPPGHLYQIVRAGYGLMPAYGPLLSVHERWAVVGYVRALQHSQYARLATLPADLRGEAARQLGSPPAGGAGGTP